MMTWIPWAIWMYKWCQNELKMNSNEGLNLWSNIDGEMMPKWTQMKTWIPWAIRMDKWCQNEHKWRLEYHEQYGWTNDAKMNSNEDLNTMSNIEWTNDAKMNSSELKWRLESHKQYGWSNDAKMNSNEDLNIMSNMDGQMMPK